MSHRWFFRLAPREQVEALEREGGFPALLARLLVNRGITSAREAYAFLYPRLSDFSDPFEIPGMLDAVRVVSEVVEAGGLVGIYADYDADGVTGAALLYLFLKEISREPVVVFPHRERHGYGFHPEFVGVFKEAGVDVIITVDCGISSFKGVYEATAAGLKVVITDHHELPQTLPQATAIVTGKRTPEGSPFRFLSGVGTAFALVRALRTYLKERGFFAERPLPNLKKYLDLVALGTVADMVPLLGENRLVSVFGLKELSESGRPGIRALKEVAQVSRVGTYEVLFRLAPRLNAAGRMAEAELAFRLLVAEDEDEARGLAEELNRLNSRRQRVEEEVLSEAVAMLESSGELPPAVVLYKSDWPLGVLGLVASKLSETYYRPVVLLTKKGELLKGSARSVPEINLYELLRRCEGVLRGFGGHAAAGGLKLEPEMLEEFQKLFTKEVLRQVHGPLKPSLFVEAAPSLKEILDPEFLEGLERLAPFGAGNPEPVFVISDFVLKGIRRLGEEGVRFWVLQNGASLAAKSFSRELSEPLLKGVFPSRMAVVPEFVEFYGERFLELRVVDTSDR